MLEILITYKLLPSPDANMFVILKIRFASIQRVIQILVKSARKTFGYERIVFQATY